MKYSFFFCLLMTITVGCREKTPEETLSTKLKKAMCVYLYKQVNNDSSKVKYQVEEVSYFPEKKMYTCDFKVRMILPEGWIQSASCVPMSVKILKK